MVLEISDDEDCFADSLFKQPKEENSHCDILPETSRLRPEENVASSSGSNLRSSFIGMGFAPSLIDRAIEEKGEDNAELLLETLFAYSELPSADSLDRPYGLGTKKVLDAVADGYLQPKEEPDSAVDEDDNKMNTLLKMNFTTDEVRFALNKLGNSASIHKLMDYIFAARMANKYGKDANNPFPVENEDMKEVLDDEHLYGIMEKTLQLLEMGFTENEISVAFERCGSEAPLQEIAESIVLGDKYTPSNSSSVLKRKIGDAFHTHNLHPFRVKTEVCSNSPSNEAPQAKNTPEQLKNPKSKTPKEEQIHESYDWKPLKLEFDEGPSNNPVPRVRRSPLAAAASFPRHAVRKALPSMVSKPPYFFYGDVTNLSQGSWVKISQFLYSVQPEPVDTGAHSALDRTEGCVHNLPFENRFSVSPKSPMTLQEALPQKMRKWWPKWDPRKQLSYVNCDVSGAAKTCERLRRVLMGSNDGILSADQERDFLEKCEAMSLVWFGKNEVGPLEPEHLELIMGYPANHTRAAGSTSAERLRSLKNSFQTDALGYYFSVLRSSFPGGLTLLSFFTGIGGAEVALHRLGIPLKGVVSVEPNEGNRRVLKQWWDNTGQRGKLIQIESVHSLMGNKLQDLMKQFGRFDLVVCQNPDSASHREEDGPADVDFSTFAEFVRVLQRVRSSYES